MPLYIPPSSHYSSIWYIRKLYKYIPHLPVSSPFFPFSPSSSSSRCPLTFIIAPLFHMSIPFPVSSLKAVSLHHSTMQLLCLVVMKKEKLILERLVGLGYYYIPTTFYSLACGTRLSRDYILCSIRVSIAVSNSTCCNNSLAT